MFIRSLLSLSWKSATLENDGTIAKFMGRSPILLDWLSGIIYNTNMSTYLTVLDTNVLLAALRSKRGASYLLLSLFGTGKFEIALSVPLVLEYEAVIMRYLRELTVTSRDVSDILDYLCAIAKRQPIYYLWRPFLRDPKD